MLENFELNFFDNWRFEQQKIFFHGCSMKSSFIFIEQLQHFINNWNCKKWKTEKGISNYSSTPVLISANFYAFQFSSLHADVTCCRANMRKECQYNSDRAPVFTGNPISGTLLKTSLVKIPANADISTRRSLQGDRETDVLRTRAFCR
jgi:hypothetical protein